ncbi:MAG: CvpA family protein [Gammaproteobacteria bacterium]|nr:MAG: CvpA family protein [Gammaproteobacteria bacterium]
MQWVDVAILGVIGVSALLSLLRGLVREVLSLVAWVLAFWVAIRFSPTLAPSLDFLTVPSARQFLAFLSLFLVTLLTGGLINHLVGKLVDSTGLSTTDRVLGMVFGLVRGGAIILLLVLLAGLTPLPGDSWWQQSRLIGPFQELAMRTLAYLPPDISRHFSF